MEPDKVRHSLTRLAWDRSVQKSVALHGGITPCMRSRFLISTADTFLNVTTRYMWVWLGSLSVAINLLKRYSWFQSFLVNQFVDFIEWRWVLHVNQLTFCEVNKALFFHWKFHECAHSKLYTVKYARKSFWWVFEIVFVKKFDLKWCTKSWWSLIMWWCMDWPCELWCDVSVSTKMYFLCLFHDACLTLGLFRL